MELECELDNCGSKINTWDAKHCYCNKCMIFACDSCINKHGLLFNKWICPRCLKNEEEQYIEEKLMRKLYNNTLIY